MSRKLKYAILAYFGGWFVWAKFLIIYILFGFEVIPRGLSILLFLAIVSSVVASIVTYQNVENEL